ncbi:30S ribosomal protein S9 [Candidatus Poribacteria bacterium]|nr:30S ribosomal protein S9 [Candidatus Poribacteria bacterium]
MADYTWGTGRRKTATARVRIRPGAGAFVVNGREIDNYFARPVHRMLAQEPLRTIAGAAQFDVFVNVKGGGDSGQAGAIQHGLARALESYNHDWRPALKSNGFLTRDARMVERKKPGRPGARKRFQFSKR